MHLLDLCPLPQFLQRVRTDHPEILFRPDPVLKQDPAQCRCAHRIENKEPLLSEIDTIIASISEYRDAIASDDSDRLIELLRDGRVAKEKVDG